MLSTYEEKMNIAEIIEERRITAHFQPIVSVTKKCVTGIEGLCRCFYKED
jgi:EAL domain-containing protein (putative c-di-GMP-specific phosphodiesterase class I)